MKNCGIQPSFDIFSHKKWLEAQVTRRTDFFYQNKRFSEFVNCDPHGTPYFFLKISEILNFTFSRFILVIIAIFRRKNGRNREILHILTILKFRACALEENLHFYGFHETRPSKSIAHFKMINACFIPLMPKLTILEYF